MSELLFDVTEGIATIALNRPEKLNAFTTEMLSAWGDALLEAHKRDDVRVIVVTGTGRAFCAGGDVGNIGERRETENAYMRKMSLSDRVHRIPLIMETLDKPVIVAVNGVATGAGMDMALMGDIRIASSSARFAETYIRIGIMAGDGGAWYLPRLIGMPKALELLWTGRFVEADEAERIGLVNHVVPEAQLMPKTLELATKIANGPPLAIRMMKRSAYQAATLSLRAHLDQVSSHMAAIFSTEDHKEALTAYKEKRQAVFVGR
jgi:2-(1,2-epoxy-1,2-dihydrophenyl)acetyl-CoA isomerase